ncbi:MAG: GDP-mannose 4,6-dehydratase [Candidatus Omnitrophota bacterium]|nr:GDP-mannose 4,6-dehydratase [Candidatus Omnitrophota bacterium]
MSGSIGIKDKKRATKAIFILTDERKDFLTPLYPKRTIEKYDGYVYCVNVPNHIIYVRRNGKVLWCGNCYDESKRFAEAITMAYYRTHNIDTRIVRIFNTYGPSMRMKDGRVVPNFIYQALSQKPITVYGRGEQTRSFCYVDDLVEGIIRLMAKPMHEPLNLGNPGEFTILEFAKLVVKLTGTKSKIIYKPLPQDDPRQRRPDITKAKKLLKWQPEVELKEGLARTIEWFSRRLGRLSLP